ncbi:MAG: 8-amino-7-oxononanoate synthase [Lentisphaeria bacterium]|nr:8-amino-7-oxononanoate synthase [Lentisphaeria bacterium]
MELLERMPQVLAQLRETGCCRALRETRPDRDGVNLSGNDYLGITACAALREEFFQGYRENFGSEELALSSASSRLLTGNTPAYTRLEEKLSSLYGGRAALVFNSGYHANIGILPALSGKGDLILADKLDHASIIDGLRLCEADFLRYRHLDCGHLESLLESRREKYRNVFIVTESVFSMDGDETDLRRLAELKRKFDCFLIVDEAHGVGVRGPRGRGLAAECGVEESVDVLIGTFGKALGSTGAYAVMAPETREFLINRMRPFIFTTALPPVILNWSAFVLEKVPGMTDRREKLRRMGIRLRERLSAIDQKRTIPGVSQIVPWIAGSDIQALELAAKLQKKGFLVFAIRPPTVPQGTARLRFSLSAALEEPVIEELADAL